MDLLGDVLKVPRQRSPLPERRSETGVVAPRVDLSPAHAHTSGPGDVPWRPSRRRLLLSWLVVVASLWSIHVASNDWTEMRVWDASAACTATDFDCLAQHDVTSQPVTARVDVTDHVARIVLTPSSPSDGDREARTSHLRLAPEDAAAFERSTLAGIDLDTELVALSHDDSGLDHTVLGLVDADGTRWSGLTASLGSVTLQAQWGLLGLSVGWFLVARRDLRPVKVAAVAGTVVAVAALAGASITTTWTVLAALIAAAVLLSRCPGPLRSR